MSANVQATENPQMQINPQTQVSPENPQMPTSPEGPAVPENPQMPMSPASPQVPALPENPLMAENPEIQILPESPQIQVSPPSPQIPVSPPSPQIPVSPPSPQIPVSPPSPQIPVSPGNPQIPVSPGNPQVSGSPERLRISENRRRAAAAHVRKPPHSTLERWSELVMPDVVHKLLFGPVSELVVHRQFFRFAFAAITGIVLSFGVVYNLPVSALYKIIIGLVFGVLFTIFATFSAYLRCSALLILPNMVGSWGRAFLIMLIMNCLCEGPISNIQHNVNEVVFSMGCNMDLQITQSKLMWRMVTDPYAELMEEIVKDSVELQKEAQNVSKEFQAIRDEVMGQYGYDSLGQNPEVAGNSTQEQYTAKTRMRCEHVVKEGIKRCQSWFSAKWKNCMDTINAPVINHFLCLPMKFEKLCNIMRVMSPWCKEGVPVEGNFGMTYDRLNSAISKLGEQFTARIAIKKLEQESLHGITHFHRELKKELNQSFQKTKDIIEKIKITSQILLSFSFITIFISAFWYAWKYTTDIRFDNVYLTTYFKLIDNRRRRRGRHFLLPIIKAEKFGYIYPCRRKIHRSELVVTGLVQVFLLALFASVLLSIDAILYNIFTIIPKHTVTNFSLTSSQDVHINFGGESMLAKLLRKTIGAFNKSSNVDLQFTNKDCLPKPIALLPTDYMYCLAPVLLMFVLCILQVYINRLRRVIMAFCFPKREKRRILFLYNLHLQTGNSYVQAEGKRLRAQGYPQKMVWYLLRCILKYCCLKEEDMCWVCERWVSLGNTTSCPSLSCNAVYCQQCWGEEESCVVCPEATNTDVYDNSNLDVYYAT